jgi:hypothetical protein
MLSNDYWPFAEPRNHAAFLTREVLEQIEPILHVVHDEDGDCQFIGSTDGSIDNARLVCMEHPVNVDPSLSELADLPAGWHAIRESPQHAWRREPDSNAIKQRGER